MDSRPFYPGTLMTTYILIVTTLCLNERKTVSRNIAHAEYMTNIDVSFLRSVIFQDYSLAKRFIQYYVVYAFSEAMNAYVYKNNIQYDVYQSVAMDDGKLDNMFKAFCHSTNKLQLFSEVFGPMLKYPEFTEFITYTAIHLETFADRIIDKVFRNMRYYDDKIVLINATLASVNLLSMTTKVVMRS